MNLKHLLLAGLLGLAAPAVAHDAKGPNGGQLTDAGSYHVEIVTRDRAIDVFLSDAKEKPLAAAGFKGLAILVIDGKPQRIVLEPATDRLKGSAPAPLPSGVKGVIQLTSPDGKTSQAKFN